MRVEEYPLPSVFKTRVELFPLPQKKPRNNGKSVKFFAGVVVEQLYRYRYRYLYLYPKEGPDLFGPRVP